MPNSAFVKYGTATLSLRLRKKPARISFTRPERNTCTSLTESVRW